MEPRHTNYIQQAVFCFALFCFVFYGLDSVLSVVLPTGKAPALEIDGTTYCESGAIAKYLAREFSKYYERLYSSFRQQIGWLILTVSFTITFMHYAYHIDKIEHAWAGMCFFLNNFCEASSARASGSWSNVWVIWKSLKHFISSRADKHIFRNDCWNCETLHKA